MVGMSNNAPISIYDGNGGYSYDCVIPGLLAVIEKAGLSYEDAKGVPKALSNAIFQRTQEMEQKTRFKAAP